MSATTETGLAARTAGATIIPFPRKPRAAGPDGKLRASEGKQSPPAIEWGGWYHDAAIAAEKPVPHS